MMHMMRLVCAVAWFFICVTNAVDTFHHHLDNVGVVFCIMAILVPGLFIELYIKEKQCP